MSIVTDIKVLYSIRLCYQIFRNKTSLKHTRVLKCIKVTKNMQKNLYKCSKSILDIIYEFYNALAQVSAQ